MKKIFPLIILLPAMIFSGCEPTGGSGGEPDPNAWDKTAWQTWLGTLETTSGAGYDNFPGATSIDAFLEWAKTYWAEGIDSTPLSNPTGDIQDDDRVYWQVEEWTEWFTANPDGSPFGTPGTLDFAVALDEFLRWAYEVFPDGQMMLPTPPESVIDRIETRIAGLLAEAAAGTRENLPVQTVAQIVAAEIKREQEQKSAPLPVLSGENRSFADAGWAAELNH